MPKDSAKFVEFIERTMDLEQTSHAAERERESVDCVVRRLYSQDDQSGPPA